AAPGCACADGPAAPHRLARRAPGAATPARGGAHDRPRLGRLRLPLARLPVPTRQEHSVTAPPRLSLIIPANDEGARLATTFGSLRQQFADLADLQVIFVDDGSSDDTAEVVETWAPRFPHFDTLRHETPHGLADSRNDGLALARADHIAFLDGDDWLRPGLLAAVHRALTDLDVDFVRCDHTTVTDGARSYKRAPMSVRGLPLR